MARAPAVLLLLLALPAAAQDDAPLDSDYSEFRPIRITEPVAKPVRITPPAWAEKQENDVVLRAMETELARSRKWLEKGDPPPYYIDYRVVETEYDDVRAELGSLNVDDAGRRRWVDVSVRVGSPKLDNTRSLRGDDDLQWDLVHTDDLPLQNDEAVIRTVLWRNTSWAVGSAQRRFKAVRERTAAAAEGAADSGDFTKERPAREFLPIPDPAFDREEWKRRVRSASAAFQPHPSLIRSGSGFERYTEVRWFVSTEGARLRVPRRRASVRLWADARADDGMPIVLDRRFEGETPEELPGKERLRAEAARLGELAEALRRAPVMEPYTGPVLLSGEAAAVFMHEILGHHLEGYHQEGSDQNAPFREKVGERILSPLLTVSDDPTRRRLGKQFLYGHYRFDEEGVPAQPALLVQAGVLKGFLLSRDPVGVFKRSNGHGRAQLGAGAVARQGVLTTQASECLDAGGLRGRLKEEAARRKRPYGIYIEQVSSGVTNTGRGGFQAFQVHPRVVWRVYADGRPDELVRGANLVGTLLSGLEKVAAAGCREEVLNGFCGAASGDVPVSSIAPALLLREMELARQDTSDQKPPILERPRPAKRRSGGRS